MYSIARGLVHIELLLQYLSLNEPRFSPFKALLSLDFYLKEVHALF